MDTRPRGSGGGWVAALAFGAGVLAMAWFALARSRRPNGTPPRLTGPVVPKSPSLLRESIIGVNKQMVQSVFGPPRAAGGVPAVPGPGRQAYWDADIWYYAIDPSRKIAMAIRFEKGLARTVEFVEG